MVERNLFPFPFMLIAVFNKCDADCGRACGFPGMGSSMLSSRVASSKYPLSYNFSRSLFRFVLNSSSLLPGKIIDGALGRMASVADSAQYNCSGVLPKYLHA